MRYKFDKDKLFEKLDNLEISRVNNVIYTKYNGRTVKTTNVSDRYEIFDFSPFAKDVVNEILKDYNITEYELNIGGRQELILISDPVEIQGKLFYKRFYLLNSSDKSRRLQMNYGLWCKDDNFTMISSQGTVSRKHLTGITDLVNLLVDLDPEVFDNELKLIEKLMNRNVQFSKVREAILRLDEDTDFEDIKATDHNNFDAFKGSLKWTYGYNSCPDILRTPSRSLREVAKDKDFILNAYDAFKVYLKMFKNRDSYIIKKETEKILNITKEEIRNNKIQMILDL